jgi:hypothetical protein
MGKGFRFRPSNPKKRDLSVFFPYKIRRVSHLIVIPKTIFSLDNNRCSCDIAILNKVWQMNGVY